MHLVAPTLTSHTTISMTGWMWKVTPQVATLSPHALTKRIQAVCCLLIDNYPLSLWMTAEHLNIGKNTVYMIAKQNSGRERWQMMKIKKSWHNVLTGHGGLCTILMTHHGEWEKFCQNWKRCGSKNLGRRHSLFCWHSVVHWEFLPESQTIKAMYQKRYWTALKKNELSDANPDPINNWFFLHYNSPSCNVAIMGSFRLTGWLPSLVTHPIGLTLLQLTLVSSLNSDLPWKVCI